jgi:hypothetical protein
MTRRTHPPDLMLRMPSGLLMGDFCIAGGVFPGLSAAKDFAEGHTAWRKRE